MRLNPIEAAKAKAELVEILRSFPAGLRTSQLMGTPRFHGMRTLSLRQVRKLLEEIPGLAKSYHGAGARTWCEWRLAAAE